MASFRRSASEINEKETRTETAYASPNLFLFTAVASVDPGGFALLPNGPVRDLRRHGSFRPA